MAPAATASWTKDHVTRSLRLTRTGAISTPGVDLSGGRPQQAIKMRRSAL